MPVQPEKPDKSEAEKGRLQTDLDRAAHDAHTVKLDGKNVTLAPRDEISTKIQNLGDDVVKQFRQVFDDAMRESKHRRDIWENDLTRPPKEDRKNPDHAVHFTINIDSKLGWVEVESWHRCRNLVMKYEGKTVYKCPEFFYEEEEGKKKGRR